MRCSFINQITRWYNLIAFSIWKNQKLTAGGNFSSLFKKPVPQEHVVVERNSGWNCKNYLVLIFTFASSGTWLIACLLFKIEEWLCASVVLSISKKSLWSFHLSIFVALLALRTKIVKFNSKSFMSDERKIENEINNYSVKENKMRSMEWKYDCAIWKLSHRDYKQRGKKL